MYRLPLKGIGVSITAAQSAESNGCEERNEKATTETRHTPLLKLQKCGFFRQKEQRNKGIMRIVIVLNYGQRHEFQNADIQKKDNGRSTAVFDARTFRILAEFKVDQISMCQSSKTADPASRAVSNF